MSKLTYSILLLGCYFIRMSIRYVYSRRYTRSEKVVKERSGKELANYLLAQTGFPLPMALWAVSDFFDFAQLDLPLAARMVGLAFSVSSVTLFFFVHRALGQNFSPVLEIDASHTLVRHGPYALVRHPMYSSLILFAFGNGLLSANLVVFGVQLATITTLCISRIPAEEKMLANTFGEDYQVLMAETPRLFPRLLRRRS